MVVSESLPRNQSLENLKTSIPAESERESPQLDCSMDSLHSFGRVPLSAQKAQRSLLEKCLRSYEHFFVKLIGSRMLEKENPVAKLFDELMISCSRDSTNERTRNLEALLNSKLVSEDSGYFNQDSSSYIGKESPEPLTQLWTLSSICQPEDWEDVLKIASSLLVELSTFTTYFLPGEGLLDEDPADEKVPEWLKVLVVCACWLSKQPSLQLISISSLLDLVALSKAQCDVKPQPQSGEGVITVIIMPLLKRWHVNFLQEKTNVFPILGQSLWRHLGELPPHKYRMRCVELLYELHHSLHDTCNAVEDVIGSALTSGVFEKKIEAFNRFITLWHLGREVESARSRGSLRTFDKSLLKVLDNLQLSDNSPLKLQAQSWLLHSLVRGDISRVLTPVLTMLLDHLTCRMSVLHVSIQHSNVILARSDPMEEPAEPLDENEGATNIYAISSVDGNVIYHVSNGRQGNEQKGKAKRKKRKKFTPNQHFINPVKVKRIFAVTTFASGVKGLRYITERNQAVKEVEVPPSISGNRKISVFINPLSLNCNSQDSLGDDSVGNKAEILKHAKKAKDGEDGSTGSLDESIFEGKKTDCSSPDSTDNSFESSSPEITERLGKKKDSVFGTAGNTREIPGTCTRGKYKSSNEFNTGYDIQDISGSYEATTEIPSWTMGDEEAELEISTTAEEYFSHSSGASIVEEVLNDVVDKAMQISDLAESNKVVSNFLLPFDDVDTKKLLPFIIYYT